jgi:hypothetical protein
MADDELMTGDRVRVVELREAGDMPGDLVGKEGHVHWVTPGFAGERGYIEVELDDGRIFQFQRKELEPVGG